MAETSIITGLVSQSVSLTSDYEANTTSVAFYFSAWRIDDGPLQQGVLWIESGQLPREELPNKGGRRRELGEHLLRVEGQLKDDEANKWELLRSVDVMPEDDEEMTAIFEALHHVSEPAPYVLHESRGELSYERLRVADSKLREPFQIGFEGQQIDFLPVFVAEDGLIHSRFKFLGFQSDEIELPPFGAAFRFHPLDEEVSSENEALVKAIFKLRSAGDQMRNEIAEKAVEYYKQHRSGISDEECVSYGIPTNINVSNVWEHMSFSGPVHASYFDDEIVMSVNGRCDWEEEHGIGIGILDGDFVMRAGHWGEGGH